MSGNAWYPGSFTKNFSWGKGIGLKRLHENIRVGFDGILEPVPREEYRKRVAAAGRPDFIPINFFLFNRIEDGVSLIDVDELVFQAITSEHSDRFDKLAIFAFNFSYAGVWKGIGRGQRYPALWAKHYVLDRVAKGGWNAATINADDIQNFLENRPEFKAKTSRKVATNLSYLYEISDFAAFAGKRIERWWVDCLFLALDRLVADLKIDGKEADPSSYPGMLMRSHFKELTGPLTPEKTFAMAHLTSLYSICGGTGRFSPDKVKDRTAVLLPDYDWHNPNDDRPQGALHPTNPRVLKTIPRVCAELAKHAGFQIILADDLEGFDPAQFIEQRAAEAVQSLKEDGIKPIMSPEELHKLTRGE